VSLVIQGLKLASLKINLQANVVVTRPTNEPKI